MQKLTFITKIGNQMQNLYCRNVRNVKFPKNVAEKFAFYSKETIVFPSYEKAHEIVMVAGIGTSSSPADMALEMREMVLWV